MKKEGDMLATTIHLTEDEAAIMVGHDLVSTGIQIQKIASPDTRLGAWRVTGTADALRVLRDIFAYTREKRIALANGDWRLARQSLDDINDRTIIPLNSAVGDTIDAFRKLKAAASADDSRWDLFPCGGELTDGLYEIHTASTSPAWDPTRLHSNTLLPGHKSAIRFAAWRGRSISHPADDPGRTSPRMMSGHGRCP